MKFNFKAKDIKGELVTGSEEADDKFSLSKVLRGRGLVPVSITDANSGWLSLEKINESIIRIKLKDKAVFASNLSAMISAGLSLYRSLEVLEKQTRNLRFKRVIHDIKTSVQEGASFSDALARYPSIFPTVFVAMVHAGEESGKMAESLKGLAEQMEKTYALRKKVQGALTYPSVVFAVMIIIGILMLIYVVPSLSETFKQFDTELPLSTRFVIAAGDFATTYTKTFVVAILLFVGAMWRFLKTDLGKRTSNYLNLHMPLIKDLVIKMNAAVVARTIASLVSAGINMIRSLEVAEEVAQNYYYKEALRDAKVKVEKGALLSSVFNDYPNLFPPFVEEMAEVGEETGRLSDMLQNIAVFYEDEVESVTKNMSTIIEPIMMIVIGAAVGFFAMAIIQPIYSLGQMM